eukprot:4846818-Pyramimonas_sp.AAC.1
MEGIGSARGLGSLPPRGRDAAEGLAERRDASCACTVFALPVLPNKKPPKATPLVRDRFSHVQVPMLPSHQGGFGNRRMPIPHCHCMAAWHHTNARRSRSEQIAEQRQRGTDRFGYS